MSYKLAGPSTMESPYIPSSGSEKSTESSNYPGEPPNREGTPPVQPVAYNPTFGEYVNHTREYAQADHSTSRGVSDIDFDDKTGTAYASLNEFQDRRVAATKMNGTHSEFASVPNKVEERAWKNVRCMMIVLLFLIVITLLISLAAASLAAYNFYSINDSNGGFLPQGTVAPIIATGQPNSPSYEQLMFEIEELKANLSRLTDSHHGRYIEYQDRFEKLNTAVHNFSAEAMAAIPDQVLLYDNCTRTRASQCTVGRLSESEDLPYFTRCDTGVALVDAPGFKTINMYCQVSNDQENSPFVTTLNIIEGEVSCACFLLGLQERPTVGFECQLIIERCPHVFNLTSPTQF